MYGYISCSRDSLNAEEQERYQEIYCGLCRKLGREYGQLGRLSLSYDMTFLILFLSSLYEPEEKREPFRCGLHPRREKMAAENKFTGYAADMTIVLAYYKCLDDWKDENKRLKKMYASGIKGAFQRVREKYPRQCRVITEGIQRLDEIERTSVRNPDAAVNCSGRMLSELFVTEEDFWSGSLRDFGFELGKFIYLMDAYEDLEEDLKKGCYNPLKKLRQREDYEEQMQRILCMMIADCCAEFERLPCLLDVDILRNILYDGVWNHYKKIQKKLIEGKEQENVKKSV